MFGFSWDICWKWKERQGVLHLLQKEQFPGIGSNQPGGWSPNTGYCILWVKFEKKFWIWERRMLNVEMVNWLNLDGSTIYNVSKRSSAFMQCGCALLNPPASKKLNPAGQSLFFVQFCTVWLEWHPVNIIHHQISGDLMMNHKNDWTSECIFFKEDASKERNDM